jgi:Cys-tRNA(Pro)/Cys-tRNA(Cys) deacylase
MKNKTNAIRILDSKKIDYITHDYSDSDAVSGLEVAEYLNQDPNKLYKTLVTVSKSNKNYVFLVPVSKELDLKKAAECVNEKNIEMIKSKDLLALTGYIHGGCSPIGMKKFFQTTLDESVLNCDTFCVSAGKIGYQIEISLEELKKVIRLDTASLTV